MLRKMFSTDMQALMNEDADLVDEEAELKAERAKELQKWELADNPQV